MKFWQQIPDSRWSVIEADTERDNWMTAEEAKAYGLIDNVVTSLRG